MLKQGTSPKIVQERLGHSSAVVTLDIYSHVIPGLQEAALRFDEGLRKAALRFKAALAVKENANGSVSIGEVPLANG
jgi:integrase